MTTTWSKEAIAWIRERAANGYTGAAADLYLTVPKEESDRIYREAGDATFGALDDWCRAELAKIDAPKRPVIGERYSASVIDVARRLAEAVSGRGDGLSDEEGDALAAWLGWRIGRHGWVTSGDQQARRVGYDQAIMDAADWATILWRDR